jgi:hypothetical protein
MVDQKQLESIPRGNTCPGVNRMIIEHLLSEFERDSAYNLLDIPCGEGEFLDTVKRFFPNTETHGADIKEPPAGFEHGFTKIDGGHFAPSATGPKFDVVTCISGVMEFDNTLAFFEAVREQIKSEGELIVTNDNLVSARDRLLYLLFGRQRQYKLAIPFDAPTWKIVPLQNLLRILHDAGFEIVNIRYVPPKTSDWLWLPLAMLVYPFQYLHLRMADERQERALMNAMFPFTSLLSRHYVVVCRPRSK